jgi:hypothetical protein
MLVFRLAHQLGSFAMISQLHFLSAQSEPLRVSALC